MITRPHRAAQGLLQALCRSEAGGGQPLADPAMEALHPAVGLGMTGLDQAMFDAMTNAGAIKVMMAGGIAFAGGAKAIGKFLAMVGQDLLHREGGLVDKSLEKTGRVRGGFRAEQCQEHPA